MSGLLDELIRTGALSRHRWAVMLRLATQAIAYDASTVEDCSGTVLDGDERAGEDPGHQPDLGRVYGYITRTDRGHPDPAARSHPVHSRYGLARDPG